MKRINKKKIFGTIENQMILSFLILASIMLFLMWAVQIIFFNDMYQNIKINEIKDIGNEIVSISMQSDYDEILREISSKKNVDIVVLENRDDEYNFIHKNMRVSESQFLDMVENILITLNENETIITTINSESKIELLLYATNQVIDSNNYYFFIESIVTPLDSTNEIFMRLLIISSVICFIIAVFFSYFLSKKINEPLIKTSKDAQQIIEGNLDVHFDTEGYTEIIDLNKTLNYAISEIKKSDILQKETIANVSHELKTPLTMIRSYAELIKDINGDNKVKREEDLNIILQETERLDYLINDIMDLSKLQSKMIRYNFEKFDLGILIEKLMQYYESKFNDFKFNVKLDNGCLINGDKHRIEQVLVNLLNNAINYSTDNKKIDINLKIKDNNIVVFSIKDYGMGVSSEDLKDIFKRHFRSIGAKRTTVGSGIGLSIVKEILDSHNLNYKIESKENIGSEFIIEFCIAKEL